MFPTPDDVASAVADLVGKTLRERPDVVLGLPAGRSPVAVYQRLRRRHASGELDFCHAGAFTLDEFVGLDRNHASSFHQFIVNHFLSGVNIPSSRIDTLNGAASNLDEECDRYEDALARAGGVGLQILGIGANGHIGFNEPADALIARTHRVTLLESTRQDNRALFGDDVARVPRDALTMGVGTILHADRIALMATGQSKAMSVERMIRGPITTRVPASLLQTHRRVEVYLDEDAARLL